MKLSKLECPYCHASTSEYDGTDLGDTEYDPDTNMLVTLIDVNCAGCGRSYAVIFEGPVMDVRLICESGEEDSLVETIVENDLLRTEAAE